MSSQQQRDQGRQLAALMAIRAAQREALETAAAARRAKRLASAELDVERCHSCGAWSVQGRACASCGAASEEPTK